jgi:signal transduction histidine kinase
MEETGIGSEAYSPRPRLASRRSTGSPVGSSTAASSMAGWVQSARERPESDRTIREMAAMLELSAALLRAETPTAAVRSAVQVCFAHLHVPLVGFLPDRSGTGWFVAAARGVGARRADIVRSIEGVSALQLGRSTRNRLAGRVAQASGRDRAESIPAGSAVLLAMDVRPDHRAFLRTAGSLLAEALTHLGAVGWAQMRNDNLDLALAVTAHELRGPLVGARAALGHVRIDDQGPESGELLRQTRDELEQLADLVDPLLRWSAGSNSLRKRQVDLVHTVGVVVASCRMEFHDADLVVRAPDSLLIRADAPQLGGAIANVVRNALAYAPNGSSVKIEVDTDDGNARVRVRDRGPGIPAAERHLIFDPFARGRLTGETRSGKGLGLFIARRIVEAHGGCIGLRSVRPGTEFRIELPLPTGGRLRSAS